MGEMWLVVRTTGEPHSGHPVGISKRSSGRRGPAVRTLTISGITSPARRTTTVSPAWYCWSVGPDL